MTAPGLQSAHECGLKSALRCGRKSAAFREVNVMSDSELVEYRVVDRVAEIVMRREPVNAINLALTQQVNAAYRRARDDEGVRAVILTSGCASAFSAGMDLAMIRGGTGLDLRTFL